MPNRFQTRLRHVADRMNEVNSETVNYDWDADDDDILASPILMEAKEPFSGPSLVRAEYQDWAIDVSVFPAGRFPEIGDTITRTTGEIFKVVSLQEDEPCFSYTTSTRDRFLIHSVRHGDST